MATPCDSELVSINFECPPPLSRLSLSLLPLSIVRYAHTVIICNPVADLDFSEGGSTTVLRAKHAQKYFSDHAHFLLNHAHF